MPGPQAGRPARRRSHAPGWTRPLVLLAVALAHLLLAAALTWALHTARRDPAPAPPLTWLRLLPDPTAPAPRPPATPTPPAAAPRTPRPAVAPPMTPPDAVDAPRATVPQAITLAPPLPASAPSAPALELRLAQPGRAAAPAPGAAALARDDPRLRGAPRSGEDRMARALGTDLALRAQALAPGRVRVERGNTCLNVEQPRVQQIDPYNQNARPVPHLVGGC